MKKQYCSFGEVFGPLLQITTGGDDMINQILNDYKFIKGIAEPLNNTFHAYKNDPSNGLSPYHLEGSVWIHTLMTLAHAETEFAKITLLFHDSGKMMVYEDLDKKRFRRFSGHEIASGNIWLDYAMRTDFIRKQLSKLDIFNIYKLIQTHHIYKLNKENQLWTKLDILDIIDIWKEMHQADVKGRISDKPLSGFDIDEISIVHKQDKITTPLIADSPEDIIEYLERLRSQDLELLIIPIGAPGSGKSTLRKKLQEAFNDLDVVSFDDLRAQLYTGDPTKTKEDLSTEEYQKAFEFCKRRDLNSILQQFIRRSKFVYVDNTNTSNRQRNVAISSAKNKIKIGIFFMNSLEELLKRNSSREPKIPEDAIRFHYFRTQYPSYKHFDFVVLF